MRKLSLSKLLTLLVSSFALMFGGSQNGFSLASDGNTATCTAQAVDIIDADSCSAFGPGASVDEYSQILGIVNYAVTGCGIGNALDGQASASTTSNHVVYISALEVTSITDASGATASPGLNLIDALYFNDGSTTADAAMVNASLTGLGTGPGCALGKIPIPIWKMSDFNTNAATTDSRALTSSNTTDFGTDTVDLITAGDRWHLKCTMASGECTYADASASTTGFAMSFADLQVSSAPTVYPAGQLSFVTDEEIKSAIFGGGSAAVITVTLTSWYNATAQEAQDQQFQLEASTVSNATHY